jgi:hypothetical protein
MNKNWNCCGDKCTHADGQVRVYPLGGGANLILCRSCFDHENDYRAGRGGQFNGFPLVAWSTAEPYPESSQ